MDDDTHVIPAQESGENYSVVTEKKSSSGKKAVAFIVVIALILLVGGGAYFLGTRKSGSNAIAEITPTPAEDVIGTSIESTPTPEPSPTPTKSLTVTPTKKPTPTPKPTATPTPVTKTLTLASNKTLDGFRSSNGGGNNTLDIRAGRNVNLTTRGFVSFDISSIPAGANIRSVTLRLYQAKVIGAPYTAGGKLQIDHMNYGESLGDEDYAGVALLSNIAVLTENPVIEWKDATVTDELKSDISAGRIRSQYRLHFTTEVTGGDVTGDFTYFESADNSEGTGNTPQLVVKYY